MFNDSTLKSWEIAVQGFKGEVQLSGFVTGIEQTNKAVEITKTISEVTSVKNDMRVKDGNDLFYKYRVLFFYFILSRSDSTTFACFFIEGVRLTFYPLNKFLHFWMFSQDLGMMVLPG